MKIVVITPTYRWGGLGEQYARLLVQSVQPDAWIIADDLYRERADTVEFAFRGSPFHVLHYLPDPKPDGYFSDIGGIYNSMLDMSVALGADLVISLQDHFWIPGDGLARFGDVFMEHPGDLCTGLASIALKPGPDDIVDPHGHLTLFGDVWEGEPTERWWSDVRADYYPDQGEIVSSNPVEWELNWASIPGSLLEAGARFDPEYGKGISLENQDFAWECRIRYGAAVWMDKGNHAIGFPHKVYWPEQEMSGLPMTLVNKEYHDAKWGNVLTSLGMV